MAKRAAISRNQGSRRRVNGQPHIVYVEWIDSARSEGWCTRKEIEAAHEALTCYTVGFLVHEDDKVIVLAHSATKSDAGSPFCSLMTIPKIALTLRTSIEAQYP